MFVYLLVSKVRGPRFSTEKKSAHTARAVGQNPMVYASIGTSCGGMVRSGP